MSWICHNTILMMVICEYLRNREIKKIIFIQETCMIEQYYLLKLSVLAFGCSQSLKVTPQVEKKD